MEQNLSLCLMEDHYLEKKTKNKPEESIFIVYVEDVSRNTIKQKNFQIWEMNRDIKK